MASDPHAIDARAHRLSRAFVWGTWAAASAAAAGYVLLYASNVPWMDDWELVPWLTGVRKVSVAWLWRSQNDHRYPVTRLLLVGLSRLTGGDYRAAMFACVLVLSAVAALSIVAAARLRGRTSWTDAFFPLVALHWGHAPNFLHHIQLLFVSATALAVAFTLGMARGSWRRSVKGAVAQGAALALLPVHGIMGLALTPPLALAGGWAGASSLRRAREDPRAAILLWAAAAALLLAILYFVGLHRAPVPPAGSVLAVLRTTTEVLAASFGPLGARAWPSSAVVLTAVYLLTGALAARAATRPDTRAEAVGLLAAIAGGLGVAVAIGAGRGGFGPGRGLEGRYAVLLLPLLVATYVCWQLFGGRGRRAAHVLLVALASAGYAGGLREGLEYGRERRRRSDALVQDLREGVTPGGLATRHGEFFYPQRSILATRLEMLREAGHGPYRGSAGDPDPGRCGAWAPAALRADAAHNMEWTAGTGRVTGRDPWVIFRLPAQTSLCAVRLTVGHTTATGSPPRLRVFWGRDGGDTFEADRRHTTRLAASGEPQSVLAWIDGPVGALRLAVDSRADSVYVSRVEWLPRR